MIGISPALHADLVSRIRGAYGRQSCSRPTLCCFIAASSASKTRLSCRSVVPLVQTSLAKYPATGSHFRTSVKIPGSTFPLLPSLPSHPCHPSFPVSFSTYRTRLSLLTPICPSLLPCAFFPHHSLNLDTKLGSSFPPFPLNPRSHGLHFLLPQVGFKHPRSRPIFPYARP